MSRRCTICASSSAGAIDALLGDGRTIRSVAAEFSVSEDALTRHAKAHLNRMIPIAAGIVDGTDPLAELVASLRPRALAGDPLATREYRLALLADKAARATTPALNYVDTAEWVELRTTVLRALEPFPEARYAVADALVDR